MAKTRLRATVAGALACLAMASGAQAAQCGSTSAGFAAWKKAFAAEAAQKGVGARGVSALLGTSYSGSTIAADRGQSSFKLSLSQFMAKRNARWVVSRGQSLKSKRAAMFAKIEKYYGVPPGPLLAIWGMETGFGWYSGNTNTLSAVATLAYDCRRSAFFTDQLYAALKLTDHGIMTASTHGAAHGEVGQTQFLPKNILLYGVDGNGDGRIDLTKDADALASTANFLKAHGWTRGGGYQPGEVNFKAIQGWNAAVVYEQALAIIARSIDEGS